jgi:hypothetical protein
MLRQHPERERLLKTPLSEVWAGFSRPFELLRALRDRPEQWRRYVRTVAAQTLTVVVLALTFIVAGDDPAERIARSRPLRFDRVSSDGGVTVEVQVEGLSKGDDEEGDDEVTGTQAVPLFARTAEWWAAVVSALLVGQWLVLAVSRRFQEPLARDLSLLAGIEPEDEARPPQLSIDVKWLRKKLSQRVRGVVVLLAVVPALAPIAVLAAVLQVPWLSSTLFFFWSAYWWCAFTAGRSARAWRNEHDAIPPFPVRWWVARTVRTFGFRWFGARWAGAFAVQLTRRDAPAAVEMERSFFRFVGLGLARFVTAFPAVRLAFRAAIDVAAAEALAQSGAEVATAAGDETPAGVPGGEEQLVAKGDASDGAQLEAGQPMPEALPLAPVPDGVARLEEPGKPR